jgi:hypothetical protein
MIVMLSATVLHLVRDEISSAVITLALLGMATFVAYMRYRVLPIPARRAGAARTRGQHASLEDRA